MMACHKDALIRNPVVPDFNIAHSQKFVSVVPQYWRVQAPIFAAVTLLVSLLAGQLVQFGMR